MHIKVCPMCGKRNDIQQNRCDYCGEDLTKVEASEVEDSTVIENATEQLKNNSTATVLLVIAGIVWLFTLFYGIYLASEYYDWIPALICWGSGLISGTLFWGFSEIIRLLHEINQKTKA